MKFKILNLLSTFLLLVSSLSGGLTVMAEPNQTKPNQTKPNQTKPNQTKPNQTKPYTTWDYDTNNPSLGEYDQLLQNAGPTDGQVDWYPAEHFASSKNIRPSLLVKQLIELSIATNEANSKARNVLFNNTTGTNNSRPGYEEVYQKYNLAFGFIAQLLDFNNEKVGKGAYLKQGFESTDGKRDGSFDDEDKIAATDKTPDQRILEVPKIGEGKNIADILGTAIFGDPDQSYAQLYVNGYDNTVQNAPNIIRETTTSITLVAQSKLTGRKATAIFKLNNKTFNELPEQVLLENNIDNSPSFNGQWGKGYNPGGNVGDSTNGTFNQTKNLVTGLTDSQKRLLSNGGSSAWVDPQTGSGTIVIPRGTSAAEIAKKIKQLGYKSNYNIANVAPMKAIHGDLYKNHDDKGGTKDNSYNVTFGGLSDFDATYTPTSGSKGNVTALSNNEFNDNKPKNNYFAVADPRLEPDPSNEDKGYVEDDIYTPKALTKNFSNALLYNPLNTNRSDAFGFKGSGYTNRTAKTIPNQIDTALSDIISFGQPTNDETSSYKSPTSEIASNKANDKLGDVVHAFEPKENKEPTGTDSKTPFAVREAWDDTHAIFGTAPFTGLTEDQIKDKIANNGSFNNTAGDQIKKSFTFNMPLNNTVMKSYRNPYSTVISTALPFSKGNSNFKHNSQYTEASGDMNTNGFRGNYITSGSPVANPWYDNKKGDEGNNFISPVDSNSGYEVNIFGDSSVSSTLNSLYLDENTWDTSTWNENTDTDGSKRGLHNVSPTAEVVSTPPSPKKKIKEFASWIDNIDISSRLLKGNTNTRVHRQDGAPTSKDTEFPYLDRVIDASNNNMFTDADGSGRKWKDYSIIKNDGTSLEFPWRDETSNSASYIRGFNSYESHLQLAKNVGYVLVNAENISESSQTRLSKYQIPKDPSGPNKLDGIKNALDFNNERKLPFIYPVDDDKNYYGGLLGSMSITNDGGEKGVQEEDSARSIYSNQLSNGDELTVPGLTNQKVKVTTDDSNSSVKGAEYNTTDLRYGLAWNDSSDLPQVKIQRSHNVQYLIPVSIARTATTRWDQVNYYVISRHSTESGGLKYRQDDFSIKRWIDTTYGSYKLYLGDVRLGSINSNDTGVHIDPNTKQVSKDGQVIGQNYIETNSVNNPNKYNYIDTRKDSLASLRPVNNQIVYTRTDNSYPHYDSELFDHGSNRKSITATRDHKRNFVGNTEEKDTSGDNFTDGEDKFVGSSDDYSIGIVHAPQDLFNVDREGVPENGGTFSKRYDDITSTQNSAKDNHGINKYTDDPKNSNGMSIGKADSYTTLAEAYNVDIVNGKAVGKADDQAKNKDDRVALVQQLLDNGGNAGAYYYIPSLPRLYEHWNEARINVVIYDQAAVPAPSKPETKPSFSTTDVSKGKDPFKVNLRPYTTVYDDGAVLKESDVPENFKNLIAKDLVAGNPDLISDGKVATKKLQQILISSFLGSWQQNDGSFNQTDTGAGVNSPLYLYGGFGISNSDSKNSYSQWPDGYATPTSKTSKYYEAVSRYPGDFYRGGKDLKMMGKEVIKGIPASALQADVSQVDLTKAGSYPVVFTYTNPNNAKDTAKITVPITVKDAAAPVFAFQGGSDTTLKVGESFDRNAFKVVGSWQIFNKYEGNYDKLVNYEGIAKDSKGEPEVTISGDVDTQTPGVYQLIYKATSVGGATTTMTRNITVLPKETSGDNWQVNEFASVGYINYVPNYGINVWNAPAGVFTGQRLAHGSAWKIFKKATNAQGKVFYNVGKNQWIEGQYVSFSPVVSLKPLKGIVTIDYVPGYGVNLWKAPNTSGGYYAGRKLKHGTQWKTFGLENGFYKVGNNQWIQGKYAKFQAQ